MPSKSVDTGASAAPMSPLKGALALVSVVILVAGYIALATLLRVQALFAGFVFSLLWGAIHKASFKEFPQVLGGCLFGILLGYIYHSAPTYIPHYGLAVVFLFILGSIYFYLLGWLPIIINDSALMFLTLGTIAEIQESENFGQMAVAVLLSAAYFGGVIYLLTRGPALFRQFRERRP